MPVSVRELDIHNTEHVKQIIESIESDQNKRRKEKAWVAFQCRNDNQLEYVNKELKRLYPKTHHKFRKGNVKVCKKVVEKIAKAYKSKPIRKAIDETETKSLHEMYDKFNFDRAFKEADDLFILHKYVYMWVTFQNPSEADDKHQIKIEDGVYVPTALAPYEYDLIRDQISGVPLIFCLSYPESDITKLAGRSDGIEQIISESQSDTSAETTIYKMWSPNKRAVIKSKRQKSNENTNDNKNLIQVEFITTAENTLGRLPGGYLQADTAVDYPVRNDLANTSIDWNISLADLKTAAATQGHGQLVISGPEGQKQKEIHMGMHSSIWLPQSKKPDAPESKAEYISASPDLSGQLDVLKFDLVNILDDEGIKAKSVVIGGGVESMESGFSKLVSEADVQDRVEDNQSLYQGLEQEVFLTVQAYEKAMNQQTFTKTKKLEIYFEKPKVLISDKETLDNIDQREEQGTLMPHEKHMILNPNLTEKQAMEREADIQNAKREQIKLDSEALGLTDPEDEEDDPNKKDDE